jgi:hypothetical protein
MSEALARYPNRSDAEFALGNDFSYAHPYSPWLENKKATLLLGDPNEVPMKNKTLDVPPQYKEDPRVKDYYLKAALATKRSALAALGFDPSKVAADFQRDPSHVNILGTYRPETDQTYANALEPSTIVHESIHRGIEKLRDSPHWQKQWGPLSDDYNEYAVRWLMENRMGDPEGEFIKKNPHANFSKLQKDSARKIFSNPKANLTKDLAAMEAAAAQYLAAKQPRGPR